MDPGKPGEPKPLTPEELQQFWELEAAYFEATPKANGERFKDITRLTYELLGRPGEALAVRWEDVNLKTGEVSITGTVVERDAEGKRKVFRQDMPKEDASIRTVTVSADTLVMLKRRKLAAKEGQTLVFPNRSGEVLAVSSFRTTWNNVLRGTELESCVEPNWNGLPRRCFVRPGSPASLKCMGMRRRSIKAATRSVPR